MQAVIDSNVQLTGFDQSGKKNGMSSPISHHFVVPGGNDSSEAFFDYSQR